MRICHVLAYGQNKDGSLNGQSIERLKVAHRLYRRHLVDRIYLTCEVRKAGRCMGKEMQLWLMKHDVPEAQVRYLPVASNTAGEIQGCLRMLDTGDKVFAVTHWYHMPRVLYLWLVRGIIAKPHVAWRGANFRADILIEPMKLYFSFIRPYASAKVHKDLTISARDL